MPIGNTSGGEWGPRYAVVLCALCGWLVTANAAAHVWTGNGQGNFWSEPANWQGTNAPQSRETGALLIFPPGASRLTSTNNLVTLELDQLTLSGSGYQLVGTNTLTLSTNLPFSIQAHGLTNQLLLPLRFQGANNLEVATNASLQLAGFLSGPGGFALSGGGLLDLAPAANQDNSYAGTTFVISGILQLDSGRTNDAFGYVASVAVPGAVIVGQANSPARAVLRGGITSTNSALTLMGAGQCQGGATVASLEGNGFVDLQQGALTIGNNDRPTVFSGQFTNEPGGGGIFKSGAGSITLSGGALANILLDVYAGGKLIVDGDFSASTVLDGATLEGNGSAGFLLVDGLVSPGHESPGRLTADTITFDLNSLLLVKLAGTNAGVDCDQLVAKTVVSINDPTAALEINLLAGFVGAIGNQYTIIRNDGTNPITGTFAGLREGATVRAADGVAFQISYTGGGGNDVVLTQTSLPVRPVFNGASRLASGLLQLSGTGFSNTTYTVWATTDLATTNWVSMGTTTASTSGGIQFSAGPAASFQQRFFRFTYP